MTSPQDLTPHELADKLEESLYEGGSPIERANYVRQAMDFLRAMPPAIRGRLLIVGEIGIEDGPGVITRVTGLFVETSRKAIEQMRGNMIYREVEVKAITP